MRVESAVVLPASPDVTWTVLTDWERQPTWMRDADTVRVLGHLREGAGLRVAVKTRIWNIPLFTEVLEVTEWRPPRRLVVRHTSFVGGTGEWTLEAAGGGTRMRWVEELSIPVPVLGELALFAYRPFLRRLMRDALLRLRKQIERG